MRLRSMLIFWVILAGCGGQGNSEPVGLYQGRWRGTWSSGSSYGILELRIGSTGNVSGSFERDSTSLGGAVSGSMKKNGDLDVSYDSTGGASGTLVGNLDFSGSINRLRGTLTRTEEEETTQIDADLTRR